MRRLTLTILLLATALVARRAESQIITVPKGRLASQPKVYVSAGIGLFGVQALYDGSTQSGWDFSQALEYHGSLEVAVGRGSALGVNASYSNVPLAYITRIDDVSNSYIQRNAHVNVYTIGAHYVIGPGSPGFHQLIVLNAGIIAFENFHADDGGARLAPDRDIDPRLGIGYGFGYGLKSRGEIFLVQEAGVSLHQSEGLTGNDRRQYSQQSTRLGFRVGI